MQISASDILTNTCIHTQAPQTASAAVDESVETIQTPTLPVSGQGHQSDRGTPSTVAKLRSAHSSQGEINAHFNVASRNFMTLSARLRSTQSESPRNSVSKVACDAWCLQAQRNTATATGTTTQSKSKFQQRLLDLLQTAIELDVHDDKVTPEGTKRLTRVVKVITTNRLIRSKSTDPVSTSCSPFLTTKPICDILYDNTLTAKARLYSHFFDDEKTPTLPALPLLVDASFSALEAVDTSGQQCFKNVASF